MKEVLFLISLKNLRFPGFDDEWDNVKLDTLINKGKAGGTPSSTNSSYYGGNIPFLSIKDMTDQGKYIKHTEKYLTKQGLDNSSTWIIPKNSLLYSIYASVGSVAINLMDLCTSQAIYGIIFKKDINLEYMYYYLFNYKKNIPRFIETGTQGNINAKILKNFIIELPCLEEQEKIANYLSNVDKKISLIHSQIQAMEEFKKGLLQKMFI